MRYIAAFDGGGTKTRCIIGDENGKILADCCGGASNHQTAGPEETKRVMVELLHTALEAAGLNKSDLSYAYAGLSGADMPSDFELLNKLCSSIFGDVPFKVVNDAWIVLQSGIKTKWGAVVICGTGANCAVLDPNGKRAILRSLSYMLGAYGGGNHVAVEALHYAFRANEGTGIATMLEKYIPETLGYADMEEVLDMLYPDNRLGNEALGKITPLVFELANQGDVVCRNILIEMGRTMGGMISGLIKRMNMEKMEFPLVLGGSVFNGCSPLFVDELTAVVHKTAPLAFIVRPSLPPVAGAYLCAMDELGIECTAEKYNRFSEYFNK